MIEKQSQVIYFSTYIPTKQTERVSYKVCYCSCKDECTGYKKNQCALFNGLFGGSCPYGRLKVTQGPTVRAKASGSFLSEARQKYELKEKKYFSPLKFLCKIGDYIFLPLPHLRNYMNSIDEQLGIKYENFIKFEDFTPENIVTLIEYKPRALFGGVITSYTEESVPNFVRQLKRYFPEIYEEVLKLKPEIKNYIISENFIGKKAFVKTLLPGKVEIVDKPFTWDGEKLTGRAQGSFLLSGLKDEELIIIPNDKTIVTISENQIVTENTEFVEE